MNRYRVTVRQTLEATVVVTAPDEIHAMDKAAAQVEQGWEDLIPSDEWTLVDEELSARQEPKR